MLTPLTQTKNLANKIGLDVDLYFKREDLHPYASHKGRSIPLMIEKHHKDRWNNFVISSSGNAALAAIETVLKHNSNHGDDLIRLKIFVGKNINSSKFTVLSSKLKNDDNITIEQVENPKQKAFKIDKAGEAKFLRQSTDDTALLGYYDLAKELSQIKNLSAVFIPTSSGTTAQGLYEGFQQLKLNLQIHIVQTKNCCPMVQETTVVGVQNSEPLQTPSCANAIVDKVAHRKEKILEIIKNSQGNGWVASNEEIEKSIQLVKETENVVISPNSALSIVGLQQALQQNWKFNGSVVCLITGK